MNKMEMLSEFSKKSPEMNRNIEIAKELIELGEKLDLSTLRGQYNLIT